MNIGYSIAAVVAAAIVLAPTAHADPSGLVSDARAHGFGNTTNAGIESNGFQVCADLSSGDSADATVDDIWLDTNLVERASAAEFVVLAIIDVCPEFKNVIIHGPINGVPSTGGADI